MEAWWPPQLNDFLRNRREAVKGPDKTRMESGCEERHKLMREDENTVYLGWMVFGQGLMRRDRVVVLGL